MKKEEKRISHYLFAVLGILIGTMIDQITKYLAVSHLRGQEPYIIIKDVFQLEYLENRGAAFGLFQDQRIFFGVSIAVIAVCFFLFYRKVPMTRRFLPLRICAVLIVAGGLGNFIDRIRLQYVIDFFYFILIDFPVFNVADIYVTVSAFGIVLLLLFYYKEEDLDQIFHRRK